MSSASLLELVALTQPAVSLIQSIFSMCCVRIIKHELGDCAHKVYLGACKMQLVVFAKSEILCAVMMATSAQICICKLLSYTSQKILQIK